MKIYVASRWARQRSIQVVRDHFLRNTDVKIISTWIDAVRPEEPNEDFFISKEGMRRMARDLEEVDKADVIVADVLDGVGRRGGMLIEIGYALGRSKPVILIGGNPSQFGVFGNLFAAYFPDWHTAIQTFFCSSST